MAIAVVYKEHTLGTLNESGTMFERLNGLGSRGGLGILDSVRMVSTDEWRYATIDDFKTFRVSYHPSYKIVDITSL